MQYPGVKRMSHISVLHTPHRILCFVFVFQHTGMQYRLSSECHTFLSFTHLIGSCVSCLYFSTLTCSTRVSSECRTFLSFTHLIGSCVLCLYFSTLTCSTRVSSECRTFLSFTHLIGSCVLCLYFSTLVCSTGCQANVTHFCPSHTS